MNKRSVLLIILLALLLLSQTGKPDSSKTISIILEYKSDSIWDTNNDGIESRTTATDFTVENSDFNWDVDETKLCTVWKTLSLETENSDSVCHGSNKCCSFIDLDQTRSEWDDTFYLNYEKYGASGNNRVSARIIYVDYNLDTFSYTSDIHYSDIDYLYAVFTSKDISSTSTLALTSSTINLTITSPENSTPLNIGEEIYLNFTTSSTVTASYSIDSGNYNLLGINNSFSSKLNGSLPSGVIRNGQHNLTIYLMENSSNIINYSYSFIVNDTTAPWINVSISNKKLNNSLINGTNYFKEIIIASNEYGDIIYKLNDEEYRNTYLDENKSVSINLLLKDGTNNLTLNVSDMQENDNIFFYVFNFSLLPSCSDGIKNSDETGIDCGGNCEACIPFNVSLEKTSFNLSETVQVTILARANSAVNITVLSNGNAIDNKYIPSYSPDFPIYITKTISNVNKPGDYIIIATMYYMNTSENKLLYFHINENLQNPLTITLETNTTNINEGGTIKFDAVVAGNTSPITNYNWNLGDGSTSTQKNPVHTYNANGTYTVNLTINWDKWTKSDTITITVKKLFNATILVKNESGIAVDNAKVELDNIEKNTNSEGKASFLVNPDSYQLIVSKGGYSIFSNTTEISQNTTIEVKLSLQEYDNEKPIIQLSKPEDNKIFSHGNITVSYKIIDSSPVECTLYMNADGGWWIEKAHEKNIVTGNEKSIIIEDLENMHYQWKIECIDESGNSQISETRGFYVNRTIETEQEVLTDEIIKEIGLSLSNLGYLGKNEQEAALALGIKEQLEKTEKELQRAKRDLYNLKWRRLNDSELEEERNLILDKIKELEKTTPKTLEVIESKEFVDYPTKEDIEKISLQILESQPTKYKKREKEEYVKYNQELQNLITITTKSKIVEIEYLSGEKKVITLIEKEIKTEKNLTDVSLIEAIPKAIAANISHITALFDYSIILEDPIIKLNMPLENYVYYINKQIELNKVKEIKSVIVADDIISKSPITGFTVFSDISGKIVQTSNVRLGIEILIIIVLLITYFGFTGNAGKIKYIIKDRGVFKKIKEIDQTVEKALINLQSCQYEKAKSLYRGINTIFTQLPKDMRKEAYDKIALLSSRLNIFHINNLIDQALYNLDNNQSAEASLVYKQVSKIYKSIPLEFKSEILHKCNALYNRLNGQQK